MAESDMEIDQVSQACCTSAYVVIVGTEQYYNSYGNKMMFWAPAVRKMLNQGLVRLPNHFFVLHFSDGYSSECMTAVNAAKDTANVTWRNNVQYVECSSIDDVFDFFDTGIVEKSGCDGVKIERVDIYAHGIRNDVSFGFYGSNSGAQSLNGDNYSQLSVDHLSPECRIWSYACRTGNGDTRGIRVDRGGFTYSDPAMARPENSLAQKLADHTRCDVLAWLTRTYYGGIFNDGGDAGFRSGFVDLADPNSSGRTSNPFEEAFNRISPFHEEKAGLVLWNTNGSKGEIVGASTPGGLSNSVRVFTAAEQ